MEDKNVCEYCIEGRSICDENTKYIGIELHAPERKLVAYGLDAFGWDTSVLTEIKYCPMCGRKLGE